MNALDTFWEATTPNGFFVKPVRNAATSATTYTLFYDTSTGEIRYSTARRRLDAADEEEEEGSVDVDPLAELDAAKARVTTLEARTVELEAQVRALAEKMEALLLQR